MAQLTKELLRREFEKFKEDRTNLDLVQNQGVRIYAPGFLVELFRLDLREHVNLTDDAFYIRDTGVCKILAVSEFNSDIDTHKHLKVGDIAFMGDHMSVLKLNPEWETWFDMQKSPNVPPEIANNEPMQYIRGFHTLISQGRLFLPDRGQSLLEGENMRFGEEEIRKFSGPFVFFLDPGDILYGTENPFGL